MFGFTESMNISVSAAICIHALVTQLRRSSLPWVLPEEERNQLRYNWYKKIVRNAEMIEREFFIRRGEKIG
jgi:tRNA (guanosine-2'-O-)-methyltransferase